MRRAVIIGLAALCASYCASETVEIDTSTTTQFGSNLQGPELHGFVLHGEAEEMTMYGFQLSGATLNGSALSNVRIEQGELVAEQSSVTLDDEDLEGARLVAQLKDRSTNPATIKLVEYRITSIEAEDTDYDPTGTGETYLYTLEENVDGGGTWQPACPQDEDGRRVAIPLTDVYDEHGDRIDSSTLFTFGCTTGAVAKCYRWGYRPWVTGYGNLESMHWTCTRVARADYCGNGTAHTFADTEINVWDELPSPGPIQEHGPNIPGMVFEAGWNTDGAVCLSHARWQNGGPLIALGCPDRLIAPGLSLRDTSTACDNIAQARDLDASASMFNESHVNNENGSGGSGGSGEGSSSPGGGHGSGGQGSGGSGGEGSSSPGGGNGGGGNGGGGNGGGR
jgi:hypothetical protein